MSGVQVSAVGTGAIELRPLEAGEAGWVRWAAYAASVLILGAVLYQLRSIDLRMVVGLLPVNPGFWLLFATYYLAAPLAEWHIFRRLWALPPRGVTALLRKQVSNELLLGYSGEVFFYAWARRHARLAAAPFGAIKDVTILSAVVGNVFCLLIVLAAAPLLRSLHFGVDAPKAIASAGVILLTSAAAMLFRRRLFTLPREELLRIMGVHAARVLVTTGVAAAMWHLLLPQVALGWWLVLGAARQLLSRLPLLPNKDVVFAGVAAMLVGGEGEIAAAMTLMATLLLMAHLLVGATLASAELAEGAS